MTNQEKLQYIKNKVIEVCPEVMELSFGCEVVFNCYQELFVYLRKSKKGHEIIKKGGTKICIVSISDIEVIGHPITLSHILRTLKVPEQRDKNPDDTYQLFGGYIHSWNMEKDSLDQQKPEVIDFLYTLLT